MNTQEDQGRIEQNVRHATGMRALREIRGIVDEVEREDEAGRKLMRIFLRWGWIILLLSAALLARHFGVF